MPFLLTVGGDIVEISKEDARDLKEANVRSFMSTNTEWLFIVGSGQRIYVDPDYDE